MIQATTILTCADPHDPRRLPTAQGNLQFVVDRHVIALMNEDDSVIGKVRHLSTQSD